MKLLLGILLFFTVGTQAIFDFTKSSDLESWKIVDDRVMGGRSLGNFSLSPEGYGVFQGSVSLDNNGGFSSVRHTVNNMKVGDYKTIVLRVKGDGKNYQFRIKPNRYDYHSYITTFSTNTEWQEIEIPLASLYPSFRGRTLDMPNFSAEKIEELAILIGNKNPENFKLIIDKISLK